MFSKTFKDLIVPKTNKKDFRRSALDFSGYHKWTPAEVIAVVKDGKLRLEDKPGIPNLAYWVAFAPDEYLQETFTLTVEKAAAEMILSSDEFRENYPQKGSVAVTAEMIDCGEMATGDSIVLDRNRLFCGVGIFGRPGSGKTSWLYTLVKQLLGDVR